MTDNSRQFSGDENTPICGSLGRELELVRFLDTVRLIVPGQDLQTVISLSVGCARAGRR